MGRARRAADSFREIVQENSDSGICRFTGGYLQVVHSIDRGALAESTMNGQNRLSLQFYEGFESDVSVSNIGSRFQSALKILKDVDKSPTFCNVAEGRQSFVLVRGSLGEEVARVFCEICKCDCTILRLIDLPTDLRLVEELLATRYQERMKGNKAVIILPFDVYEIDTSPDASPGTILDHPHWEALALLVAFILAKHSAEDLIINLVLSAKYSIVGDDVALISCRWSDKEVSEKPCFKPLLVHGVEYISPDTVETGYASRQYYGIFSGSMFDAFEVLDFQSKNFWGCFACHSSGNSLEIQPMAVYLHVPQRDTDISNLWHYLWEKRMPPSFLGVHLLVSMPGSGQSYVRFMLELISQRPTRGVEMFFTRSGKSLAECFPEMDVDVTQEAIVWMAHSARRANLLRGIKL